MPIWHLTFASDGRHPMFPTEEARRAAVRLLVRAAGSELALFCIVDDYAHIVAQADRPRVAQLARAVVLGLRPLASAPVEPAHLREVETRSHATSLVGYVLDQVTHHGLAEHPALWTGSCFQDLAGARWLPGLDLRLWEILPRLTREAILAAVGLTGTSIAPASDVALRAAGIARLAAAVAAAHAVPQSLAGNAPPVVTARRAVAHLATACGIATADVAWALNLTPRAARRLTATPAPPALLRASRLRLALVEHLTAPPAPART